MPKDTRSHKGQGVSSYAHGANHAQRGRYGISGHRDDNINPSQYQSRSDPLEPSRGGSNIPLPGIGALHEQLRQDNEAPTSSRDTAGQNSALSPDRTSHGRESLALHSSRLSNTRGAENIDRRGERDTQGSRNQFWDSDEDDELIDFVGDGHDWAEIAARLGRTESSVKSHWYYGNLNRLARARGVSYKPLQQSEASRRSGPRP